MRPGSKPRCITLHRSTCFRPMSIRGTSPAIFQSRRNAPVRRCASPCTLISAATKSNRSQWRSRATNSELRTPNSELFHFPRRRVPRLRDDLILDRLAVLDNPQRLVGLRVHQFHFDLAELAVMRRIRGMVGDRILVAKRILDGAVDGGEFAVKTREERLPTGVLGESLHFVVGLQEVEPLRYVPFLFLLAMMHSWTFTILRITESYEIPKMPRSPLPFPPSSF